MTEKEHTSSTTTAHNRAFISYTIGFLSSIALTLIAYGLVVNQSFNAWTVAFMISGLAFIQCAVQLLFFLHIGDDTRPRWKLISFVSMLIILAIVVIGSLWIMNSLNYRMHMTPEQMNQYMQRQTGI